MLGLCIKYQHANYGSMLQAYATEVMLEKQGIEYEIIRYKRDKSIKDLPRVFNRVLQQDKYELYEKKAGLCTHPDIKRLNKIRIEAFKRFEQDLFTKTSPIYRGYEELYKAAYHYDAVLTGSDQLWSPAGLPTNFYNLMFVPDEIKKISYSSSFGVRDVPPYQSKRTAEFLKRIDYVSMREIRGQNMVKWLTGREVPVMLDPVLMFSSEEWDRMIPDEKDNRIGEPYIFAYFLGNNVDHRRIVTEAAKRLNCKVLTLRHLDTYNKVDENIGDFTQYDIGPDGFLNLIRNADYVCTDSYYGMCFSIIYHKQFAIFNRYKDNSPLSKNSRIDTLCMETGLHNRRYLNWNNLSERLNEEIDYGIVNRKTSDLIEKSKQYLGKAISYERRT